MNFRTFFSLLILVQLSGTGCAQQLETNGGIMLKASIVFGNQNQWLKIGAYAFGILNYGDASVESGLTLSTYHFFRRHTVKTSGTGYSYEFFTLGGVGKNTNLLGAAVATTTTAVIGDVTGKGGFNGLGFGVSKDILPEPLRSFNLKRGSLLMRFSNRNHSIHFSFSNDVKLGRIFKGEGTDYGPTASLRLGITQLHTSMIIRSGGFGFDLFTPQPDYSKAPRNPTNSHDGRKNVWFVLPPFEELFYGNLYVYGGYQDEYLATSINLGINSMKAGAQVQNTIHDGAGLNPRFPWPVTKKDKLYFEAEGSLWHQFLIQEP